MSDLMKSIKGDYIPEKRTIIERLKAKFTDDILFFNENGHEPLSALKGSYTKLQKVRDAAAIILEDIRSHPYETNKYPPSDNFLKDVNTLTPETLSTLLSGIICQSKSKSLIAAQRKCSSIAHSIIAATRPASFISPLLLGVDTEMNPEPQPGPSKKCRKE
ncbi:hypothetical protein WA026_004760 [Henosepilachna vigintioctopunctata]|uniref:Uncharacterized protein n=1 Tax=Henosepilachna vigintioctopunctata TaxID=420089 RepID=A0AAW1V1B6_9CUCU